MIAVQEEVEKLMRRLDVNDSGTVEFEEFCAGMIDWKTVRNALLHAALRPA